MLLLLLLLFFLLLFILILLLSDLIGRIIHQSIYESPHLIDTDVDQMLMVWPMCDGRDVLVSIQEDHLALEVKSAPLAYDLIIYLLSVLSLVKIPNNIL